jgi:hypothetical protein
MAGLVPAIHVFLGLSSGKSKTWMPGTRPGMTAAGHTHALIFCISASETSKLA